MKHPLHPMLVHLPIGLWLASLIFDIVYMNTQVSNFALASYYCIAAGIIGALLAAPAGFAELLSIPDSTRPRRIALLHMTLNLVVVGLYVVNFFARRNLGDGGAPMVVPTALFLLSLASTVMLGISGYLGGMLVYQYGIGFRPEERDVHEKKPDLKRVA